MVGTIGRLVMIKNVVTLKKRQNPGKNNALEKFDRNGRFDTGR